MGRTTVITRMWQFVLLVLSTFKISLMPSGNMVSSHYSKDEKCNRSPYVAMLGKKPYLQTSHILKLNDSLPCKMPSPIPTLID